MTALDSQQHHIVIMGPVLHAKQTPNVHIWFLFVQPLFLVPHVHFNQNVLNILQGHFATQEHVLGALQTLNAVVHLSQNAQVVIFVLRVNKVLIAHYKQENIVIVALVLHVL
jgi:hypothetical protein